MYFSKFRDDKLDKQKKLVPEKQRLIVYKNFDFNSLSFAELVKIMKTISKQKSDFKYLVNNFDNLNDKEFFKYYKTFYKWDNAKLDTLEEYPLLKLLFTARPDFITDASIEVMYSSRSDVFKKIRSEFTKEILESDYKKYCKAQKKTLEKVIEALENKQENNESSIL